MLDTISSYRYALHLISMPGGLDEAAAIIAILTLAFQLTKGLATYAADVKDAREDIETLRRELKLILTMSQELDDILRKNEKTKVLKGSNLLAAQHCRAKAATIVKQLTALSKKAGAKPSAADVQMTLLSRML